MACSRTVALARPRYAALPLNAERPGLRVFFETQCRERDSVPHLIRTVRRPDAVWRARVVVLTTFVVAAACDQLPTLPTSPSIADRTASHGTVVSASVVTLPTLGGVSTSPVDINTLGEVVGSSSTGQANHAFLWAPGLGMRDLGPGLGMRDLGTLGGRHSFGTAINNAGQVVGSSDLEGDQTTHAFLWTPEKGMQDLGTLEGTYSSARAIDDAGRVIGISSAAGGLTRTFLWTPGGGMQDLGVPGVIDVNNAGQMAGTASFNGEDHAFLWTPGQGIRDLGNLDGQPTNALALNEAIPTGRLTGSLSPIPLTGGSARAPVTLAFTHPAGPSDTSASQVECGNGTTLSRTGITSP